MGVDRSQVQNLVDSGGPRQKKLFVDGRILNIRVILAQDFLQIRRCKQPSHRNAVPLDRLKRTLVQILATDNEPVN